MSDVTKRTISIFIDQTAAEVEAKRLQSQIDVLTKKIKAGTDAGVDMGKEFKKLEQAKTSLKAVEDQLDKGLAPSLAQQSKLVTQLRNELKRLSQSDASFAAKSAELKKQDSIYQQMKANVDGVKTKFDEAGHSAGTFTQIFKHVAEAFSAYKIIETAFEKVKEFFTGSIEEAEAAEEATNKLRLALENAGRVDLFGTLSAKADELAEKFKRLDNDDIKNVFTKLVDYGKLSANQINDLTEVIVDFSAKQKLSLEDGTDVILRALEGNARGLKTYGINIKDASTISERFGVIMNDLGSKVKGAEAEFEKTNRGVLESFKQRLRDIEESVGKFLESLVGLKDRSQELAVAAKKEATEAQGLVSRYEELSSKTNKTAEDKAELQRITSTLATTFGNSVVEIDKETGALKLNLSATKDLIKQKLLLANTKAVEVVGKYNQALNEYNDAAKDASTTLEVLNEKQNELGLSLQQVQNLQKLFNDPNAASRVNKLTDQEKEVIKLKFAFDDASAKAKKYAGQIESLSGDLKQLGFSAEDANKLLNPQSLNDPINGDPNADPEADKKREEALKAAEDFYKRIRDLQNDALIATQTEDQKEILNIKHKYDEVIIAYEELQDKLKPLGIHLNISEDDIRKMENSEVFATLQKQMRRLFDQTQKDFDESNKTQYQVALNQSEKYFAQLKELEANRFVNGEIDEATYQKNIVALDQQAKAQQIVIAKNYTTLVEQAALDVTKFQKAQLDQQVADAVAAYEKSVENRRQIDELLKQSELQSAQARAQVAIKGSDEEINARKALLEIERKQRLAELEQERKDELDKVGHDEDRIRKRLDINNAINEQIDAVNKGFDNQQAEIRKQQAIGIIDAILGYANEAFDIVGKFQQAQANRENAELNRELKANDAKKAAYQRQLNSKLISQKEYDFRVAQLDADAEKKKEALAKKQLERTKKLQIAQTLINAAAGAIKLWVDPGFPAAIPLAIALAAQTAAEVAVISSQKYARGGKLFGASHDQGGMPVMDPRTGRKVAELEGDEGILKKSAMRSRKQYTVTGTPSEIASTLNYVYGGVKWDRTASIKPLYASRPYRTVDVNRINKTITYVKHAQGGIFNVPVSTSAAAGQTDTALISTLENQQQTLNTLTSAVVLLHNRLQKPIEGKWSLSKLEEAQNLKARILDDANFR